MTEQRRARRLQGGAADDTATADGASMADESPTGGEPVTVDEPATEMVTPDAVIRFDPHWCLVLGRTTGSSQLETWLPYLARSRHRFAILAPGRILPEDRTRLAALANCIIVEPYEAAPDWLARCRSFEGYLYVATQQDDFTIIHRARMKGHVFIGHGESAKRGSGSRTGSIYDSVFVSDYGVVRRFPKSVRRWVRGGACAIGAPVVEGVHKDRWMPGRTIRTVLYASTWESGRAGGGYSSLEVAAPALLTLLPALTERGIRLIVRPHPRTGRRLPELKTTIAGLVAAGAEIDVSKREAFERADVLISDVSGLAAEFLLTEKPVIITVVGKTADRDAEPSWLDVEYPWAYRWNAQGESLLALLATIESDDRLRRQRASAARQKYRHHRSIDDAVRTFDVALTVVRWRRTRVPVRLPFEAKLLAHRVLRRG